MARTVVDDEIVTAHGLKHDGDDVEGNVLLLGPNMHTLWESAVSADTWGSTEVTSFLQDPGAKAVRTLPFECSASWHAPSGLEQDDE